MNKRKLRRILRESIRDVLSESSFERIERMSQPGPAHPKRGNCPSHYDWDSIYRIVKSMRLSSYGEPPTRFLKAWNRNKFKKGLNIPPMLYDQVPECAYALIRAASQGGYDLTDEGYQAVCDAWMEDADQLDDFSWNYDPDTW